MPNNIGLDAVTLVGIFVESVLYGFFTFLFAVSTFVLLMRRKSSTTGVNKTMLIVSVVMFILATVHVGVDLRRLLSAFLDHADTGKGPVAYLSRVSAPIYVLKSTAYAMQTLVGDGFVLYRLYMVWNGDKRVVFPILICFIASIGVGIGALQGFARASPSVPVFITELHNWIVSFFSLTLFTNFTCTSLIAGRIWWVHRKIGVSSVSGRSLVPAVVVVIESGAIYSACLIILLSLYLSGSFAQYIVLDAVTQVIGVVFSLVIVRVGLGLTSEATSGKSQLTLFGPGKKLSTGDTHQLRPLAVSVSKVTHADTNRSQIDDGLDVPDDYFTSKAEEDYSRQGNAHYVV